MPPIRTVFCLAFSTALFLVPPVGRIFAQEPQAGRQPGNSRNSKRSTPLTASN